MIYGFTGTRNGMNKFQRLNFRSIIECLDEFHHGCCVGADAEASEDVDSFRVGTDPPKIIGRPGPDAPQGVWDELLPAKTYFARNRDIVNACDVLIGAPPCDTWQERGGTFYTLGYAIKVNKPVIILWPDGRVERR